jgi:hypothetical protein
MVMRIYDNWSDDEYEYFCSQDWVVDDDDNWWEDLICCDMKKEWGCEELTKSIQSDLDDGLSIVEIKEKYLK